MKRHVLLMVLTLALAGCALSPQQEADQAAVRAARVPEPLYNKMTRGAALSVGDVVTLSRARVGDDVIVRYIREQGTIYRLTRHDVAVLREGGVSPSVIDFMDQTDYRGPDSPWGP